MRNHLMLLLLLATILGAGCSNRRYHRLIDEKLRPTPRDQEIKLYVNEVVRPHVQIAYVQSFADTKRDATTRREQLQEMRETARKLGADAIMSVRQVKNQVRGMVRDERAPIPMVRHGDATTYMLRGTAVRFLSDEEAITAGAAEAEAEANATADTPVTTVEEIPTIESLDPEADSELEIAPRGLQPIITP